MVNDYICVSACNKCYIKCKTELANCLCCLYGFPEWEDIKCFLKCHHPPTFKIFIKSFCVQFSSQLLYTLYDIFERFEIKLTKQTWNFKFQMLFWDPRSKIQDPRKWLLSEWNIEIHALKIPFSISSLQTDAGEAKGQQAVWQSKSKSLLFVLPFGSADYVWIAHAKEESKARWFFWHRASLSGR